MDWLISPPVLQLDQFDITVELRLPEVILRLFRHVETDDPAPGIRYLFKPFLIIILVPTMKIKHIFRDQDELRDPTLKKFIRHLPFKEHNVVLDRIIPFPE